MKLNLKIAGHSIQVAPDGTNTTEPVSSRPKPNTEAFVRYCNRILEKYRQGKQNRDAKIIENDKWFRALHWQIINQENPKTAKKSRPEPVSEHVFYMIASKHADAMDNFPDATLLPRRPDDEEEAERLTNVCPLILEKNYFRSTYSKAWWYKLKQGCVGYGVFWNQELEGGLGDIDIKKIDILNLFWQPGIEDINDSKMLFLTGLVDDEEIIEQYPQLKGKLTKDKVLEVKTYSSDDSIDTTGMSVMVDCYYRKRNSKGRMVTHLQQYVDAFPVWCSETTEKYDETGIYEHGLYPIILDPLFPLEGTPDGFGIVDLAKNPQMYIDKLDQTIVINALVAGKQRFFLKKNSGINPADLADFSKTVVEYDGVGRASDNYEAFQANPLHPFIMQHRQNKIQELKEIVGARDFSEGGTAGGVTAWGAIEALQEAGNKLSRDMIGESYVTFTKIISMVVELIRQYYNHDRYFRILGPEGKPEYIAYNNSRLKVQQLPPAYEGDESFRKPVFDIKIKPVKANPFSKVSHNQMAMEMFKLGMFKPEMAQETLTALEVMTFEGKDQIVSLINEKYKEFQQVQALQAQLQQYGTLIEKMRAIIYELTGKDIFSSGVPQIDERGRVMVEGGVPGGRGNIRYEGQ